jgi:DNA helicase HerA-like ATPase
MKNKLIGKVLATEKVPTTMDSFCFWTQSNVKLNAFDVVKVAHLDMSSTYGVVEQISHITDSNSFLNNFISNDFGEPTTEAPTLRLGMNYVKVAVTFNDKGIYNPILNDSKVFLATADEITYALGLKEDENSIVCGHIKMYEGSGDDEVTLPVPLNSKYLIGPEGAHLNISGISGLAAKTSYAMFLLKAIQDYKQKQSGDDKVAFVIFNVKGKDLMAIDEPNDFDGNQEEKEAVLAEYEKLKLLKEPFKNGSVKYHIPYVAKNFKKSTYLKEAEIIELREAGKLNSFAYLFEDDKESIDLMFSNIDDSTQTMDSIIDYISTNNEFASFDSWHEFLDAVKIKTESGQSGGSKEITVASWRKFYRIINKAIRNDEMFATSLREEHQCRLEDALKEIKANDVHVIDIAKLPEDKQAFVFGSAVEAISKLQLGEYDDGGEIPDNRPDRIIIFIDELNKYASKEVPKNSPILKRILDVAERGRSLGIILFAAEQFRSAIHDRVTGNCSTHAYGRTNSTEVSKGDYKHIPETYKNMMTRLSQGEYIIQNPTFRSLLKIKFPKPIYKQFK